MATRPAGRFAAAAASVAWLVVMFSGCQGQCSGKTKLEHASSAFGNFTSPGYPDTDYPNNLNCSWQIVGENPLNVIHLHVNDLQLDSDYANCRYDFVDLYDGNYYFKQLKRGTPVLARLCNAKYGRDYYSTTPYLFVLFISDSSGKAKGFSLSYRAVPREQVPTPRPVPSTTPLTYKGEDTEITISDNEEEDKSGLKMLAVIGGIFGTFLGLIVTIAVFICICRQCLKLCEASPASTRVPRAPPPEETQQGRSGRPQRDPLSYTAVLINNSDSGPSRHLVTHRDNGHRSGRSSRPGSHLEPSNSRSGSPGPGSREGGSPRRSWHLDVPERGHHSGSSGGGSSRQGRRPHSSGRDERPRSSGAYPSPTPPPQASSARTRYSDPPPSYDEVMGSFPEPSAPPLPPSDYR